VHVVADIASVSVSEAKQVALGFGSDEGKCNS